MNTNSSTLLLTALALCAFAGNSILCRLALTETAITPDQFSLLRLSSGALFFVLLRFISILGSRSRPQRHPLRFRYMLSGFCLFAYAVLFSHAYLRLDAATGALVLFLTVQISMTLWGMLTGQRSSLSVWFGMALALVGFLWWLWPSASGVTALGVLWMGLSGLAWAAYSLIGRNSSHATEETGLNFIWTLPWCLLLWWMTEQPMSSVDSISPPRWAEGTLLAVASGVLTSAVGYAIWYRALPGLSAMQAGVAQLTVPLLTAALAVMVLGEEHGWRLLVAISLTLSGLYLVLRQRLRSP